MNNETQKGFWDRRGGVKIHAVGCPMLRRKGVILDAAEVADMLERKYTVVYCKCTKEDR